MLPADTREKIVRLTAGDFGDSSPLYKPGDTTQLFHYEVEARDMWVDALNPARRPMWVLDNDPRAVRDCEQQQQQQQQQQQSQRPMGVSLISAI